MNIGPLPIRFDVSAAKSELEHAPWGQYPWRTQDDRSPHREITDIWMRYNAIENLGPHFNDAHMPVWYPVADRLLATKSLALAISDGLALGGVLVTKVPAGKQVYPHVDHGWHALHYEKFAVQIAGNSEQAFRFKDEKLSAMPGECYWFNNQSPHWVTNDSAEDRITLICCVRRH